MLFEAQICRGRPVYKNYTTNPAIIQTKLETIFQEKCSDLHNVLPIGYANAGWKTPGEEMYPIHRRHSLSGTGIPVCAILIYFSFDVPYIIHHASVSEQIPQKYLYQL